MSVSAYIRNKIYFYYNKVKFKFNRNRIPVYFLSKTDRNSQLEYKFQYSPLISVVVPVFNTDTKFLYEMIRSLVGQTYQNWELCLADASDNEHSEVKEIILEFIQSDKRIKYIKIDNNGISVNTNNAISIATGDYIGLLDHDDLLAEDALFEVVKVINEQSADFIYSDEATFQGKHAHFIHTNFKPDFSPDTLRGSNYICHFSCFKKSLYSQVGEFDPKCDGSQDHDMFLRLTEKAKSIVHIPKVLYFWRAHKQSMALSTDAKNYCVEAGQRAVQKQLDRLALSGNVYPIDNKTSIFRIKYDIIGNPKVSIVIPNKDHVHELSKCIDSILEKSTYDNYEIIIIENNSVEESTFDFYKQINNEKIKIVYYKEKFNFAKINNFAVSHINGEYLLFLNNDIEIITPDWIQEMLMYAQRKDVGIVGAKLYYSNDTIQHAGVVLGHSGIAGHLGAKCSKIDPGYSFRFIIATNVSAVTGACMMMSKEIFEEVNGFDEEYAVAFNDIDLCMKVRKKDYLIVVTPFAELYHHESQSRGAEDTEEKRKRFFGEIKRFDDFWHNDIISGDIYYNPNLTLVDTPFLLKRKNEMHPLLAVMNYYYANYSKE